MKSLQEIEKEVAALARRIGASKQSLPTYGISHDGGHPHVEVKDGLYHYVVVERGEERERRSSVNYDDLLYWIFRDITHGLAFFYELMNRVEDQDCRRIAFPKQIKLMRQLDPKMGERLEQDIADILRRAPYDDEPTRAVNRMRKA
jgi:Immunity protein 63